MGYNEDRFDFYEHNKMMSDIKLAVKMQERQYAKPTEIRLRQTDLKLSAIDDLVDSFCQ